MNLVTVPDVGSLIHILHHHIGASNVSKSRQCLVSSQPGMFNGAFMNKNKHSAGLKRKLHNLSERLAIGSRMGSVDR